MKTSVWLLVLAVSIAVLAPQAIAAGNWKHKKTGVTESSKSRHLSLEIDSMAAGTSCTAASHAIQGLGGTLKDQWAKAFYKLEVDPDQNLACTHYDYIRDSLSAEQLNTYIGGYLTENCEINLLGGHRHKQEVGGDWAGNTVVSGTTNRTIVYMYAGYHDGIQRSVNSRIDTELHENACHHSCVGAIGHCGNTCPCNDTNSESVTFCGSKTSGCLKKLIEYVHVD